MKKYSIDFDFELGQKIVIFQEPTKLTDTIVNCLITDTIQQCVCEFDQYNGQTRKYYRLENRNYSPEYYKPEQLYESMEVALSRGYPIFESKMKSLVEACKKNDVDKSKEVWQMIRDNPQILSQIKLIIKKGGK